jgi:hypothetical protein
VHAFEARASGQLEAAPAGEHKLSHDEIVKILEEEGAALPPEAGAPVEPTRMSERDPSKAPYGKWFLALVIVFSLYTLWQALHG